MNIYIASLVLTILISAFSCYFTFKKRNITGAKALFALMCAVSIWAFCYILEILSKSFETKLIWYNCEYFGVAFIPVFWFTYALFYADADKDYLKKYLPFAFIIPVIIVFLVWTNSYHNLFVSDMFIAASRDVPVLLKTNGPGYWLHIIYSFSLTTVGAIIFLNTLFKLPKFFLRQGMILIIGAMLPLVFAILYAFNINPFFPFDITPAVLSISGILLAYSLVNLKSFQVAPFARDLFFDKLEDKIMVTDNNLRIIDMNKSMEDLFKTKLIEVIGFNSIQFLKSKGWSMDLNNDFTNGPVDFVVKEPADKFYYSVSKIPIIKNKESLRGFLFIFHEITNRKKIEKSLQESNKKIRSINKYSFEINKSESAKEVFDKTSDALTEIFNLSNFCIYSFEGQKIVNKCNKCSYLAGRPNREKILKKIIAKKVMDNANPLKEIKRKDFNGFSKLRFIPFLDIGTAVFFVYDDYFLSSEDSELCELLLSYSAETVKRFKLQDNLKEQAQKDPLTGCFNRRYFNEIIEKEAARAKRYNYPILFLMVDINRFKEINDRFGHQTGDKVLSSIGKILIDQVRKIDTVFRYGGDEFLIMLPGMHNNDSENFITRIGRAVKEWELKSHLIDFNLSLSIGKNSYDPKSDESMEKILHYADMDMYSVKNLMKEELVDDN